MLINSNDSNIESGFEDEGLVYNSSTNAAVHDSSHLMQQTSFFNTKTHSESKDESILNLNL